jgi:hypothetical protein
VVLRMSGSGEGLEPRDGPFGDPDVRRRDGGELTPELVEGLAVQPAGTRFEPRRIDDVRRADLGDVDDEIGVSPDEYACCARVIEMDVRQQQVTNVGQREASLGEPRLEALDRGGRAAVEQCRAVLRLDDVRADRPGTAEVEEIDGVRRHRRGP